MRLPGGLAAWWAGGAREPGDVWLYEERAGELRERYLEHLNEEPLSLGERATHHLYHLMLYWSRWIGFMDLARATEPGSETEVTGSLMGMVRVGSELSDADVREYCRETGAAELLETWVEYDRTLRAIQEGASDFAAAARRADARFARVDELRTSRGPLHPFETRPPRWRLTFTGYAGREPAAARWWE